MAQQDGTPGVQKISVKHTEIMNFMLMNPTQKLADVAKHFGYTQPWLSCIIHSEAFQAQLSIQQEAIFNGTVLPIKEKMLAMAHQGLDQLSDRMPMMKEETVAKVTDSVLDRLGFGSKMNPSAPPAPGGQVNLTINLRQELEDARKLIGSRSAVQPLPALEVVVDGHVAPIGLGRPAEVQAAGIPDERQTRPYFSLADLSGERAEVSAGHQV